MHPHVWWFKELSHVLLGLTGEVQHQRGMVHRCSVFHALVLYHYPYLYLLQRERAKEREQRRRRVTERCDPSTDAGKTSGAQVRCSGMGCRGFCLASGVSNSDSPSLFMITYAEKPGFVFNSFITSSTSLTCWDCFRPDDAIIKTRPDAIYRGRGLYARTVHVGIHHRHCILF